MRSNSSHSSWLVRLAKALARPKNQRELMLLLKEASQKKLLDPAAFKMIEGVLKVYKRQVRDIMIPSTQMVVIEEKSSLENILPILISSGHSRFPIIGESKDEIIGMLLAKDLLQYMVGKEQAFDIHHLIRPITFIPESKRLNLLLEEFRLKHNHLAIVVDEYGSISGMLTIEDVLEEIVGEIEDEYDVTEEQNNILSLGENAYRVKALTTIAEFNVFFHANFSDEHFDTIGGLVISHFGHMPKRDESVLISQFTFKILSTDKRKIRILKVIPPKANDREERKF